MNRFKQNTAEASLEVNKKDDLIPWRLSPTDTHWSWIKAVIFLTTWLCFVKTETHCRSVLFQLHEEIRQRCGWDGGLDISVGDSSGNIDPVGDCRVSWRCHHGRWKTTHKVNNLLTYVLHQITSSRHVCTRLCNVIQRDNPRNLLCRIPLVFWTR